MNLVNYHFSPLQNSNANLKMLIKKFISIILNKLESTLLVDVFFLKAYRQLFKKNRKDSKRFL